MTDIKRGHGRGVDVAQQQAAENARTQIPEFLRGGAMIEDVAFAASATSATVQHKLGRQPRGWMVLRMRQAPGDFTVIFEGAMDKNRLVLNRDSNTGAVCTVDVWVY